MSSRFHRVIAGLFAGIATVSPVGTVSAAIVRAATGQSTKADSDAFEAIQLLAFKWGWLIGIVLIALVVVRRKRKAP
jgi:uncharacterized membrane protein